MKQLIFTMKTYFLRGHNGWFVYIFWFANVIGIWHLAIIPQLKKIQIVNMTLGPILNNFWLFVFVLVISYSVLAVMIGKLDYKKGSFATEAGIQWHHNPEWKKQVERTKRIEKMLEDK